MPKYLSSWALFFMSIFLYGKHIKWQKLKETKGYLIKSIIALVLAVVINRLYPIFISNNISEEARTTIEIILLIPIGIFWYKEHKRITKKETGQNVK